MAKMKAKLDPPAGGPLTGPKFRADTPTQRMKQAAVERVGKAKKLFASSLAAALVHRKKKAKRGIPQNRGQKTVGIR